MLLEWAPGFACGGRESHRIYAKAYNQKPEEVAFYEFTRTMQSYKAIIAENTTLSFPRAATSPIPEGYDSGC
jgi:hypothetical protein